jgi:hypothetical protein
VYLTHAEYAWAGDAVRLALEIDPDYAAAYNTLAMTQKLMGANEKAEHNYDEGAKALARVIAKSLRNAEDSPRLPHWPSRTDLWTQYALVGAMYLAAHASAAHLAWPTGEMAERDARTVEFRGWYWQDRLDAEGKLTRLFLPNYFNTFCARLRADSLYANLIGNRSTMLRCWATSRRQISTCRRPRISCRRRLATDDGAFVTDLQCRRSARRPPRPELAHL